ncbi:MAG: hypothetical protein F6K50_20565 [Moorea sp. SIO3I7]|nr:hypothetical protein [Moorena sp. SIO3I7]
MGIFVLMVVVKSLYTFLPIAYCLLPGASPKSCLIPWCVTNAPYATFTVPCSLFPVPYF